MLLTLKKGPKSAVKWGPNTKMQRVDIRTHMHAHLVFPHGYAFDLLIKTSFSRLRILTSGVWITVQFLCLMFIGKLINVCTFLSIVVLSFPVSLTA